MLVRLREWWNRPDPMTAIILWQMDQTMEWVNKWHDQRNWSRLWKQAAKDKKALADKRLMLLKKANTSYLHGGDCVYCYMVEKDVHGAWKHAPDCELAEAIAEE